MTTSKRHDGGLYPLPEEAVFAALITPNRSLDPRMLRRVLTLICLASVAASVPFILAGAWPVAGFFGLDLLALYVAFHVNMRRGGAFEQVVLTRLDLLLRQVSHRGEAREWHFNPSWTRLVRETNEDFGVQRLTLVSRGQRVVVGAALSAEEKASFGDALSAALAKARHR
ncbi:DUF2244 domain-containing protein [Chelatococcus sp. SYSU_G07232]|uniref:DUF2244 domain-containing protein n=1 Tax=Chelatococcus albus TaxID=3047466 RepID=A0ABT7AHT1_9HYPH|nr:DUF2244 domain-containing protein [Chelatococcus sp. SYSU_G07232]MDJ1158918.1 DUF2244 domain-containing protein [Chelatococcus sp. SYSU_G07232]